jgi:hypothetical protein
VRWPWLRPRSDGGSLVPMVIGIGSFLSKKKEQRKKPETKDLTIGSALFR